MDGIAQELTCPICLEVMNDPRILQCQHSACSGCLQRIAQANSVNCPICRRVTPGAPAALPSNRQLKAVCDMLRSGGAKPQAPQPPPQQAQFPAAWGPQYATASAPPATAPPAGHAAAHRPAQPPPAAPGAPSGRTDLEVIFDLVDEDRDGRINEAELRSALLNDDNTPFDMATIRTLFSIVDTDRNRLIDRNEFIALYQLLQSWRAVFEQSDRDRSGTIDEQELWNALCSLGFRLDGRAFGELRGRYCRGGVLKLDAFLQCCIQLRTQQQQGPQGHASSWW
eukprot:tig00001003_g6269.t1